MIVSDPEKVNTFFSWGEICLRQSDNVLKVGTDAILLGSWVSQQNMSPHRVLDVGSGTGILALMMAQKFPHTTIDAIDIHPEAVKLASENFMNSKWNERLQSRLEDVLQFQDGEAHDVYDLIIINPPFYTSDHLASNDPSRKLSRHSVDTHLSWLFGLHHRLLPGGSIYMVIPYAQAGNWIAAANQLYLYAVERVDVFSFEKDVEPKRTLLCFRNALRRPVIMQLVMYKEDGVLTEKYNEFIQIRKTDFGNTRTQAQPTLNIIIFLF